ncbi:adenosylcobalamin-dependent ribonucleoside-diphosphate reductase [candidate division WWE3 bacterium]|uniref:Vitamin B12-dependent ribonucleotide reductase n=1 Tax=candidate division WWE3 bacterium TaxID=2053526 RepID=A0A955LGZ2_UNCKA|nr:adenosylcobalamin-dependent ribonucleoside-diphosphate reductase [candidate division WWE3 bacterium]
MPKTKTNNKPKYFKEPVLAETAEKTLRSRCSLTDESGKLLETPGEIFLRVASHIAKAEINWGDEKNVEEARELFFTAMAENRLIVTRSALYEAGNPAASNQLSPCFVIPVEDSIPSIFENLGKAALVQKNYGGTGFNFSNIRPHGDKVKNVPNAASGPVDFLQVYSAALSKVMQGAKRHGGNMGILNVDHPDILDFITVKDEDQTIKNFNISVGVTNEFMEAVEQDKMWDFINPRNKQSVKKMKARKLFDLICEHAWISGDPGLMFLDRTEEDNYTPTLGVLNATNPCGEQPLLPFESCNLSSVNLAAHLKKNGKEIEVDWEKLADTAHTIVRFLDNKIEVNTYILPETENIVKFGNRKIGAGVIGFAHVLYQLGIPYNSEAAVRFAKRMAKFMKKEFEKASLELAKTRGPFPNYDISTYKGTAEKYRNCTMFTIAPTGTVSMIANTTSGIEPVFSLAYERRTFFNDDAQNRPTETLQIVDPILEKTLKEQKLYSKNLIHEIAENGGSLHGIKEIPDEIKKIFVTTHDIDWSYHVKIQAAWQAHADNSVSKTINLPNEASVDDVRDAYMKAWKLGCKGVTIYRDGSKMYQVMATSKTKKLGK